MANERVALVTGGSRGIGAGIAKCLLDADFRVAVGYLKNREGAERTVAGRQNGRTVKIDVGDAESVSGAFEEIGKILGSVDVLVNNAGIAQEKPFLEISEEDWERMLSVNLLGAVRCIQRALPGMLGKGFGRVINVCSIGGQWGGKNQVHYAAAKAGLINLTRSMARLYSDRGITSNAVSPGLIATDMSKAELESDAGKEKVRGIPAGRLGTPWEVGEAVAFLASEKAAYVTGQTLNLNGGMYFD